MTMRTSSKTVTFTRPFALNGMDRMQPAGIYAVDTDEELLEGLSFPAYRWLATSIRLPTPGRGSVLVEIVGTTPRELDAALATDAVPVPDGER
jgi:hypothetical protein